eukprot:358428-Pleurochrysis_carterae.AAC.1
MQTATSLQSPVRTGEASPPKQVGSFIQVLHLRTTTNQPRREHREKLLPSQTQIWVARAKTFIQASWQPRQRQLAKVY